MTDNASILIVDDEDDIRMLIRGLLEDEGYNILEANSSEAAYEVFETSIPNLVIQDIWLQGSENDGIDVLKNIKEMHKDIPFIMISGHGTIETAVSAIKFGAYDFIEKPFKSDRLLLMISRALENAALRQENAELKLRTSQRIGELSTQIPQNIRSMLDKVAKSNSRIFITGEAGAGKNIAAQYIHEQSARCDKPLMTFNCASLNPEKLEAELFGVQGTEHHARGLLDLANGGTLLLDEVISLPIEMQGKILMLLQEGAYHKVGSNKKIAVDIRIIATSSDDVEQKISEGSFREDLYYRLNVVPIHIPALRERKQEIPDLITHYLDLKFSTPAMAKLQSYPWPGNIKQLHNVLEWVTIMNDNSQTVIEVDGLPPELGGVQNTHSDYNADGTNTILQDVLHLGLREARECFERHYLLTQIEKFGGNISKTAEHIGMERSALHRKLKSLDVFSDDKQNVA
ncbi:MAG: sigma-54-dependent transcriptional regulator [Alphaproteobacteria bacterium]